MTDQQPDAPSAQGEEAMTNEDIDRMLEQAVREAAPHELYKYPFARIVAAAEREACAKAIDDLSLAHPGRADLTALQCAAAIRARGEKK